MHRMPLDRISPHLPKFRPFDFSFLLLFFVLSFCYYLFLWLDAIDVLQALLSKTGWDIDKESPTQPPPPCQNSLYQNLKPEAIEVAEARHERPSP